MGEPHKDYESYHSLAEDFFGIRFQTDFEGFIEDLTSKKGFHTETWKFKEIFEYYDGVRRNGTALFPMKCYTVIESYPGSCGGKDCTTAIKDYHFIDRIKWTLRDVGTKRICEERGLGNGSSSVFTCIVVLIV